MHARIDQLLSHRDGEPVDVDTLQHMEGCPFCASELARLKQMQARLQALPVFDPPALAWQQPVRDRKRIALLTAAAACAVVAVAIGIVVRDSGTSGQSEPATVQVQTPSPATESQPLEKLVAQSRELDELLQHLPERPSVERVSMAATLDTIEQRIQWLDVQLSYAPETGLNDAQAYRLWRERVDLMDSLVKVRYAEGQPLSF